MNDIRGSIWRKWDLHVHTPCSIVQEYGGNTDHTWEKYISALEGLPPEIKVLGINDYIFIDGYRKVRKAKVSGRLENIDLILPVIELRLSKFGGTDSHLSRVNLHIIFSDEVDPDIIEEHFLRALPNVYHLEPKYSEFQKKWKALATRKSLQDLGKMIIESVPASEGKKFRAPLIEGFNSINFEIKDIREKLSSHYFERKHLTAVGKTEWWNIKWNDKSIAEKKDIINGVDLVFVSAASPGDYEKAKKSLTKAKVNNRLLDCSDAHDFSTSTHKDKLGNCFTWIKSDTTFEGLKLVLVEPEERIFIGDEPQLFKEVRKSLTRYVKSIKIRKNKKSKLTEKWFDCELPMNHGLVAIIGNRGSGKSALADIIGLLGNSRNYDRFSFLNNDKFLKPPEEKGKYFSGTLVWESDEIDERTLSSLPNADDVEKVKYIPQDYFESICNELGDIEEIEFDKELKDVIFSHVKSVDRLGQKSIGELISYKTAEIIESISVTRDQLTEINNKILKLEAQSEESYKLQLHSKLKAKNSELTSYDKSKPAKVEKPKKPETGSSSALKKLKKKKDELTKRKGDKERELDETVSRISELEKLQGKLQILEDHFVNFTHEIEETITSLGLTIGDIVTLDIDYSPIEKYLKIAKSKEKQLRASLDEKIEKSLPSQLDMIAKNIKGEIEKLDEATKLYDQYLEQLNEWEGRRSELIGDKGKTESIKNLEFQISELEKIPAAIKELRSARLSNARSIYRKIKQYSKILAELFSPLQEFFDSHEEISKKLDLRFDVSIVNAGFQERFFEFINRNVSGSFIGISSGRKLLGDLMEHHDLNKETRMLAFADEVVNHLQFNMSSGKKEKVRVQDQLKKGKHTNDLYNFIYGFEYLQPRYVLKLGNMELSQLSPGQRGALLIIFYLLIDQDRKPLIIDQPEHNLDNETVTDLLVPAIREAKSRRQLFLVTHNPILAVVCNADQIICASLDIEKNHSLSYMAGAIENPTINRRIVDVLEGTMIAFDNRGEKYLQEFFTR